MAIRKTDFMRGVLADRPTESAFTVIEQAHEKTMLERDVSVKLPVIDGPCKGQRMAQPGEQFTFDVNNTKSKSKAQVTYCLRRHRLIGLVWALPSNKSVIDPR